MRINHQKLNFTFNSIFKITILIMLLFSCDKEETGQSSESASVSVSLTSIEMENWQDQPQSSTNKIADNPTQVVELKLDDSHTLVAELRGVPKIKRNVLMATNGKRASLREELAKGIKYRVLVYDASGSFKYDKLYTSGSESTEGGFVLDSGVEYTFVAYSFGNASTPPLPSTKSKIATDALGAISLTNTTNNALLHALVKFRPTVGTNYLGLVLKNKLSEIHTTVDTYEIGIMNSISGSVSGHYSNIGSVQLSDGKISTSGTAQSRSLVFGSLGDYTITSNPTIVYLGEATTTTITVNVTYGLINRTFKVTNMQVLPGYRYILNISAKSYGIIAGDVIWAKGNLTYQNGLYRIRTVPEETGYDYKYTDYWNYASPEANLLPAMNTTYRSMSPAIEFPVNDPCRLVAGGMWRMPTLSDFESLGPPTIVSATGTVGGILNGLQPNGTGNTVNGTKENAGYLSFTGIEEQTMKSIKLKFFAGGGLRGAVYGNIPVFEPDISTFRNFDAVYHAIDSQNPNPSNGLNGVPVALSGYVFAPATFLALNENSDGRFNFLSHRHVHTDGDKLEQRPYRDSRFPIRCVKDR